VLHFFRVWRGSATTASYLDQEGAGATIVIVRGATAHRPVKCLQAWLDATGITEGAVFRSVRQGGRHVGARLSDRSVCALVESYARPRRVKIRGRIPCGRGSRQVRLVAARPSSTCAMSAVTIAWTCCELTSPTRRHSSTTPAVAFANRLGLRRRRTAEEKSYGRYRRAETRRRSPASAPC
jgi:hypothetical protein